MAEIVHHNTLKKQWLMNHDFADATFLAILSTLVANKVLANPKAAKHWEIGNWSSDVVS